MIKLTESQLHKIIKESINKVLREEHYPHYHQSEDYLMPNGDWDNYAFDYDRALDTAQTPEEWDEQMRRRDEYGNTKVYFEDYYNPSLDTRIGASMYTHPESFGIDPNGNIDGALEKRTKYRYKSKRAMN